MAKENLPNNLLFEVFKLGMEVLLENTNTFTNKEIFERYEEEIEKLANMFGYSINDFDKYIEEDKMITETKKCPLCLEKEKDRQHKTVKDLPMINLKKKNTQNVALEVYPCHDGKVTFNIVFLDTGEIRQKRRSKTWVLKRVFESELKHWGETLIVEGEQPKTIYE